MALYNFYVSNKNGVQSSKSPAHVLSGGKEELVGVRNSNSVEVPRNISDDLVWNYKKDKNQNYVRSQQCIRECTNTLLINTILVDCGHPSNPNHR